MVPQDPLVHPLTLSTAVENVPWQTAFLWMPFFSHITPAECLLTNRPEETNGFSFTEQNNKPLNALCASQLNPQLARKVPPGTKKQNKTPKHMKFLSELTLRRWNLDAESYPHEHPQGAVGSSAHVVPVDPGPK